MSADEARAVEQLLQQISSGNVPADLAELEGEDANAEEYEMWRSNSVQMYKSVTEIALEWPSLTFDWLPEVNGNEAPAALVGTYTNNTEDEFLQVISPDLGQEPEKFVTKSFPHDQEVNRTRHYPHSSHYAATINPSGELAIYDLSQPDKEPMIKFSAHKDNGYGLAWDPVTPGRLLTGADDGVVSLWEIDFEGATYKNLATLETETGSGVNDVAWASKKAREFAVAAESGKVYIYTVTTEGTVTDEPRVIDTGSTAANSLAYNPYTRNMLAVVSADSSVTLWDLRDASPQLLHSLSGHQDSVTVVKWCPFEDGILATAGQDRRVIIWDIRRIGQEQGPEDSEDAAPELLFMHGGHQTPVSDFDWHPTQRWLLGSVAEDNICQIWVPSAVVVDPTRPPALPKYII